ncbi:MAG: hypothetical protein LUD16_02475, partial [Lachnospiraceae bacterium]|nr:hypothetical protein [Lachnospiraceae bacterium]
CLSEDFGSEDWFILSDELWQRLSDREIVFTADELDYFYYVYLIAAENADDEEKLAFGLETYTELLIQLLSEMDPEDTMYTSFDVYLLDTADFSMRYDELIANTFRQLGEISLQTVDLELVAMDLNEAADDPDLWLEIITEQGEYYAAQYCYVLAELLENQDYSTMESLALEDNSDNYWMVIDFAATMEFLLDENAAQASAVLNKNLSFYADAGTDEDSLSSLASSWITAAEIQVWRGFMKEEVFNDFVNGLDWVYGYEVTTVSVEAQEQGLRLGDLIVGVNDVSVASMMHFMRLSGEIEGRVLNLVRDGQKISLNYSQKGAFEGEFVVKRFE